MHTTSPRQIALLHQILELVCSADYQECAEIGVTVALTVFCLKEHRDASRRTIFAHSAESGEQFRALVCSLSPSRSDVAMCTKCTANSLVSRPGLLSEPTKTLVTPSFVTQKQFSHNLRCQENTFALLFVV